MNINLSEIQRIFAFIILDEIRTKSRRIHTWQRSPKNFALALDFSLTKKCKFAQLAKKCNIFLIIEHKNDFFSLKKILIEVLW